MGDPFLDTVPDGGAYDALAGDRPFPYGHASYTAQGDGKWGLNYLRSSIELVFSGSYARITELCRNGACVAAAYRDGATIAIPGAAGAGCAPQQIAVRLTDANNNPLPFETTVSVVSANKLSVAGVSPAAIPSTRSPGGTVHQFTVTPDAACAAGDFSLQTKTPTGKITEFKFTAN
jgi:hypothetical protein